MVCKFLALLRLRTVIHTGCHFGKNYRTERKLVLCVFKYGYVWANICVVDFCREVICYAIEFHIIELFLESINQFRV